jgi:hypothetical protein
VQRFPFVAEVQVTALDTGTHLAAHTEDLSLCGCFVETTTPFINPTRVGIRISHDGTIFTAQGTVVHARERAGMGIRFAHVERRSLAILDNWLAELQNGGDQRWPDVAWATNSRYGKR